MEAWRFGFDPSLPPAFKFDPTDADLVAYYLLPRALNLSNNNPYAHAVVDADPGSCPPWELLRRQRPRLLLRPATGGAVARTARGVPAAGGEDGDVMRGKWRGQKGQEEKLFLYRVGAGEEEEEEIVVTYKKYNLTYYDKKVSASGWVMQEYQIVDPPMRDVLARIKVADRASKQHRKKRKAAAAETMSSYQEGQAAGTSSSADQVFGVLESENDSGDGMQEPVVNYTDELLHSGEEGIGFFVDGSNNYVMGNMDMDDYYNQLGYGDGNNNYYGGEGNISSYYHDDAE
ncbi:hypothetical protein QOZ80_9BG0694420 [Eleusine coracana subsp. coracana]|nr:hypothetical protein QOZ80_9BG0694150 [Eleusine coracana subsp. coracana]KAK3118111.1 hypothetical protein QOZ80_9BG0694420 [Eleusine coracana subsp. coracana]